ncbi:MAG: hypothetical protein HFG24_06715 [Anaerotruncus sp.]|nr:hypothetical protein [Anaerotruncus sp.]
MKKSEEPHGKRVDESKWKKGQGEKVVEKDWKARFFHMMVGKPIGK